MKRKMQIPVLWVCCVVVVFFWAAGLLRSKQISTSCDSTGGKCAEYRHEPRRQHGDVGAWGCQSKPVPADMNEKKRHYRGKENFETHLLHNPIHFQYCPQKMDGQIVKAIWHTRENFLPKVAQSLWFDGGEIYVGAWGKGGLQCNTNGLFCEPCNDTINELFDGLAMCA